MLRGVALGLAVLGLTGAMALGQEVSVVDAGGRSYGDFASDDSFVAELWLADFGDTVDDYSMDFMMGSAVTADNFTTQTANPGLPSTVNPFGWSRFIGGPADTAGGLLVATLDVTIAGGDDTSSYFGIDGGSTDTFVSLTGGGSNSPSFTGLAGGGQLVPEPATMALLLAGVGGGLVARRRRRS